MRIVGVAALALLLASCDRQEVKGCEDYLKSSLRSPATYQRVSATVEDQPTTQAELKQLYGQRVFYAGSNPALRIVTIISDSANAYGTPVRSTDQCAFKVDNGKLDRSEIESRVTSAKGTSSFQRLIFAGAVPSVTPLQAPPAPKYSCCLL